MISTMLAYTAEFISASNRKRARSWGAGSAIMCTRTPWELPVAVVARRTRKGRGGCEQAEAAIQCLATESLLLTDEDYFHTQAVFLSCFLRLPSRQQCGSYPWRTGFPDLGTVGSR